MGIACSGPEVRAVLQFPAIIRRPCGDRGSSTKHSLTFEAIVCKKIGEGTCINIGSSLPLGSAGSATGDTDRVRSESAEELSSSAGRENCYGRRSAAVKWLGTYSLNS